MKASKKNKNLYELATIVNGDMVTFKKEFSSRQKALDYGYHYLEDNFIYDLQLEEEIKLGKHDVEYVLNNGDRLLINRVN